MIGISKTQFDIKQQKSVLKTKYSLPPNVNGQCRGRLSLCLHELHWLSDVPSNFDSIITRIIWWGDAINSSAFLKYVFVSEKKIIFFRFF